MQMSLFPIAEAGSIEKTVHHVLVDHDLKVLTPMLDDILQRFEQLEIEVDALKTVMVNRTQV